MFSLHFNNTIFFKVHEVINGRRVKFVLSRYLLYSMSSFCCSIIADRRCCHRSPFSNYSSLVYLKFLSSLPLFSTGSAIIGILRASTSFATRCCIFCANDDDDKEDDDDFKASSQLPSSLPLLLVVFGKAMSKSFCVVG